jgi:sugar/nucleoside kinase (ribokinase family)
MNSPSKVEVLTIGQPLLDKFFSFKTENLEQISVTKGGSQLLNSTGSLQDLLKSIPILQNGRNSLQKIFPGGSCSNTTKGLSQFGISCGYIGKIGKDEAGKIYDNKLKEKNVKSLLSISKNNNTGECVCLITEDGERTMRTFLGASSELKDESIPTIFENNFNFLYTVGYFIYNKPFLTRILEIAKEKNKKIGFSIGSFEICKIFKNSLFESILPKVHILFANEKEAFELCSSPPEHAVDYLTNYCEIVVITCGPKGCWVKQKNFKKIHVNAFPLEKKYIIDSTGAGDLFAAGFLYGYLNNHSIEICAKIGCLLGREVIQYYGAEIPDERISKLKYEISSLINQPKKNEYNGHNNSTLSSTWSGLGPTNNFVNSFQ